MADEAEKTASKNVVTIEDAGPCRKKVSVEIPEEAVKEAIEEQYKELGRDAVLPGFRKGRAPRRLLEKRFGKETSEQIKLKLLAEASDAAIKDNELKILGEPDIDHEKIELPASGAMKFDFEAEVRPEFELPELEGIPVEKKKLEVTDEQLDREIEQLLKWSGVWAPREEGEKIQVEDQIIGDAVVSVEGVEEGEKLDNIEIHVRHNGFVGPIPVEDLDELLKGAKAGDVKETTVEVPQTFFREEYRGKKAGIRIQIEDVKFLKPAEMNAEFLARFGADSAEDLREMLRDRLQSQLESDVRSAMTDQVYKYLLDKTDFELPLEVVADQAQSVLQRQYVNLLSRGTPKEKLQEQFDKLRASSDQQARSQLKTFFIMDKVAGKLEISVSDEEVNGHIAQLAIQRNQRPERLREDMSRDGSLAQFSLAIRDQKVIEKLLESAKMTEVEAKEKPAKAAAKAEKHSKKAEKKVEEKAAKKTTKKTAKKATKKTSKKASAKTAKDSAAKGKTTEKAAKKTKPTRKKKTEG